MSAKPDAILYETLGWLLANLQAEFEAEHADLQREPDNSEAIRRRVRAKTLELIRASFDELSDKFEEGEVTG